jgi:hypothetical protein
MMGWQEDNRTRVSPFPTDVQAAHIQSRNHRDEVIGSTLCGCCFCCATFPPTDIVEWVDVDREDVGQTALCPKCGIDSVIGDQSGFPAPRELSRHDEVALVLRGTMLPNLAFETDDHLVASLPRLVAAERLYCWAASWVD